MHPQLITDNLQSVLKRIARSCHELGNGGESVTLLCISKTVPTATIQMAIDAGQRHFGENYVDEAVSKIAALAQRPVRIQWHFVGSTQSNKTEAIARNFDWVHSVERVKIARLLAQHRPRDLSNLQVCIPIQVNIGGEASKGGVDVESLPELVEELLAQPRLTLRGLMSIPPPSQDPATQRGFHRRLHEIFLDLQRKVRTLDTLSMGMSQDLETAISEGSTMVRVGTDIFGARSGGVR